MSIDAGVAPVHGRPVGDVVVSGAGEGVALEGAPLRRVRAALLVAYGVVYVVWVLNAGIIVDRISVLISVGVLLLVASIGRPARAWRVLAVDFVLYAAMWIAYDETRGAADRLGMPLQVTSVRDADRFLLGGTDATVWLQARFFSPDDVRWYDVVASLLYFSHFVVPVAAIAALWLRQRRQWVRFMRRFATLLAIACASFVLLPTAPPWMAGGGSASIPLDAIEPVERPAGRGLDALNLDVFVQAWETGRDWANPVAAMPSLHAAFALFVVAFWWPRIRRPVVRVAASTYPIAMGVSLVYLAEHWIVDILAGWVLVGVSFAAWHLIERRSSDRAVPTEPTGGATDAG